MINVSESVPIVTSQQLPIGGATSTSGSTTTAVVGTQSVEYRDAGVVLTVTPRIGEHGTVALDVKQEVNQIGTKTPPTDSLSIIKRAEKPLLVFEMVDDSLVNELQATIRERHHATPTIGRVWLTLDQSHGLEAIETVGHGTRRENDRVEEPSWVHAIGRARSAQCREDEVLAKRDSVTGEDARKAGGLQKPKARDALERMRR